jgi:hypothetical protein
MQTPGHSPPKVARPRTPAAQKALPVLLVSSQIQARENCALQVTRILSGPASSVRTDPDPQKDHPERGNFACRVTSASNVK